MTKRKNKLLIALFATWSILGLYADSAWLSAIPPYLIPLTAICSLYPPLLTIWYTLKYYERHIPQWFTYWIIIGAASYGITAQFYFPLLMSWVGINFHDVGSMFWVAVYGSQAFILFPYLKKVTWKTALPGIIFIMAANYAHYIVPTFLDFTIPGYPIWMKNLTVIVAISIQIGVISTVTFLATKQSKKLAQVPIHISP